MYSIGDIIDKLVIENIKIFKIRESLSEKDVSNEEYVERYNKMNTLNQNRSILMNLLDDKVERVVNGEEKNCLLKFIRTYGKKV